MSYLLSALRVRRSIVSPPVSSAYLLARTFSAVHRTTMDPTIMTQVIDKAAENIKAGGGPFAAAIVKDGVIVALEANGVTRTCDPTAHAEVCAIRAACKHLNSFQLDDCELYTSCYPCPMCFGAAYWARVKAVYYAATAKDAADVDFDDAFIYEELKVGDSERKIVFKQMTPGEERLKPFNTWREFTEKTPY